jgi:hypothetical protein
MSPPTYLVKLKYKKENKKTFKYLLLNVLIITKKKKKKKFVYLLKKFTYTTITSSMFPLHILCVLDFFSFFLFSACIEVGRSMRYICVLTGFFLSQKNKKKNIIVYKSATFASFWVFLSRHFFFFFLASDKMTMFRRKY